MLLRKFLDYHVVPLLKGLSCSEEFFYQLGLRQFGDFHHIKLDPPPALADLVTLAVEAEEGADRAGLTKAKIVEVRFAAHPT